MPKPGFAVVTIYGDIADKLDKFVKKVNKGKKYQHEKVSKSKLVGQAIKEFMDRQEGKEIEKQKKKAEGHNA